MSGARVLPDGARLGAALAAAAVRARAERRAVLVALVERVAAVDPLAALDRVAREAASDVRLTEQLAAGRVYWTRERDGFAVAGLGAVATFSPSGPDRFASVDRDWSALLAGATIVDDDAGAAAVPAAAAGRGPILFGGFSFEPAGPRSEAWEGFPSAHLIVPRIQLACVNGACWLTLTALVDADGEPDVAPGELAALGRALCSPTPARDTAATMSPGDDPIEYVAPIDAAEWRALVGAAVAAIRAGSLHKVVLAREVRATAPRELDVFAVLRHLRAAQPDCFVFGYWRGERAFVGASPERLARLDGREVRASSLAGSAKRGATPAEDAALARALLASAKDRSEHAAVRDALRDWLAELCVDVEAPDVPSLLTVRHVHHLHTPIRATLRRGHSLLDVVARLHPTPAVGGAPREDALRFIRRHERLDRGWYAAPIGWLGRDGGEFAVGLRSAVIAGREATLFAGCGIVAASDPALELAESQLKLRPIQAALAAAVADAPAGSACAAAGAELAP